jgi:hypothetical protein
VADDDMNDDNRDDVQDTGIVLTDEQKRRQRARSVAIALSLGTLALLFFGITIVRLGAAAANQPL